MILLASFSFVFYSLHILKGQTQSQARLVALEAFDFYLELEVEWREFAESNLLGWWEQ